MNTVITYCRRAVLYVLFPFLMLCLAGQSADGSDCFIGGPYVLHVEHDRAQIVWVTPAGTDAGSVAIEAEGGAEQQSVTAEVTLPLFQDRNSEEGELDHLRHLSKVEGLQPHTEYHYEVQCGDGESTESGRFRTPPKPDETVPVEFVAVADGHAMSRYSRITEPVGELKPDFVIHAGDLRGGRGHDWDRWETYFDVAKPYLQNSIFLPVVGGHDVRPARNFRSLFAFNDPDGDPVDENSVGTYYSHRHGNLEVFVIDHIYDREEQLEWLDSALAASDAKWKIVATHESRAATGSLGIVFTEGSGGWFYDLAILCENYGVDLVIGAHYHVYERLLPIGSPGNKPVHYVTINSNGNARTVRPSPITTGGIGQSTHMYSHFRVDGNRLEMEAVHHDGSVIDRLELVKDDDGMYQDEVMEQAIDLDLAIKLAHIYNGLSLEDVLSMRYERSDIEGSFKSPAPDAGETATLTLNTGYAGSHERDLSRFPIGSHLIVYEQDDSGEWQTEYQEIEITGNSADVEVTAPEGLTHSEDGFNIPLKLNLNVKIDGRKFEPVTVLPTLVDKEEAPEDVEPGTVNLMQPESNDSVTVRPEFKWSETDHAFQYQLQVGEKTMNDIVMDTVITGNKIELPVSLNENSSYVWRVRGLNDLKGPWSDEHAFYTKNKSESDKSDFEVRHFSDELKPALRGLELPEVSMGSFGRGFRGNNSLFTWLDSDNRLNLEVTGGTISQYQDRGNVQFYLSLISDESDNIVASDDSVPPDGESYEIVLESPYSGLHYMEWDDGNDRTYLNWPEGTAMTVRASKNNPFSFQRDFNLYFYVPEGTSVVGGYLNYHSNVRFRDSDGETIEDWQNSVDNGGYFALPVNQGQDGALWSVEADRNRTLSLMTVPPYLARNEEELLLPVDVMDIKEPTGLEQKNEIPSSIKLGQNYPNPFNPTTSITYSVPDQTHVNLSVYNLVGQRVATLVNDNKPAGRYEVIFDAGDLSSGVYLYRLQTDTEIKSRQMLLVK